MDRIQRNGGTAGIVAGLLLALLFVLFLSLGQDIMAPEPAKSLAAMTQKWSTFQLASLVGLLTAGVAVPFVVGIATRLRDSAPTRARAFLYITLLGLAGYGLESVMRWFGGRAILNSVNLEDGDASGTRLDRFLRLAREYATVRPAPIPAQTGASWLWSKQQTTGMPASVSTPSASSSSAWTTACWSGVYGSFITCAPSSGGRSSPRVRFA